MNKKEKLQVYNDCIYEINALRNGNSVQFCHYDRPWTSKPMIVEKEHDYYIVDNYILTNFLEVVAMAYRHTMKGMK